MTIREEVAAKLRARPVLAVRIQNHPNALFQNVVVETIGESINFAAGTIQVAKLIAAAAIDLIPE